MIRSALEWLGNTPWSIALLESAYAWPLVETTHVLGLALFLGTAIVHDLRLLGWSLRDVPASEVTNRILPWTHAGFVVMVVTGVLIFYSNPLRYYHSLFFRVKVLLLVVAGLNAFVFHRGIHKRVADWDLEPSPPREARAAGAVSLAAWALVVVAGRMIAYDWFDCANQPQAAWINWLAGCVLEP